ncbi:MAG: bifunctional purine biosynthesis protein PurH [Herpetosiphonaceae bacterium]|nr:MAG: bifunctional purine biosynthesis protein PurH [Herpetosiphonaceae bacterium]
MRAVVSVSDKRGIVAFARALTEQGTEIISTGGTKRALAAAGIPVRGVSEITGFPEILDGRVKTLHPAIHGGILARRDRPADLAALTEHAIGTIDLVVVNLYPFAQTIARPDVTLAEALEQIDIGGPTLLRAAAKNHPSVLVVVDPDDYEPLIEQLRQGSVTPELRRQLAAKAFAHTAAYDSAIAAYLADEPFPEMLALPWQKVQGLRYGENPHQPAAFYREPAPAKGTLASARQRQGKELSFNNLLDADAALQVVRAFAEPAATIIKHTNPCGLACDADLAAAHKAARSGDPVSAFGGIVGFNRPVDGRLAEALKKYFYEVIVAPGFSDEALAILAEKPNLRLLEVEVTPGGDPGWDYRRVSGGLLIQRADDPTLDEPDTWQVVTKRVPSAEELEALWFAWRACAFVKSNAIVLAQGRTLVGMGAGQLSRVDSVLIATRKAGDRARGSVLASDAFFPKPDGVETAAAAGVSAIVQPGGSVADEEVIAAADRLGLAMVFTGRRHFRH